MPDSVEFSGHRRLVKVSAVTAKKMLAMAAVGAMALAGCSSTTAQPTTTTTGSTTTTTTTSTTTTTEVTTSSVALAAVKLAVTAAVRAQLVEAGAALNDIAASAYTGLASGRTYYAYDPATTTYWAGAALVASPSSQRAQVSVQDDGGYLLFSRPATGAWKAQDVGLTGIGGTKCSTSVPASILALWHWAPGTCRAPN